MVDQNAATDATLLRTLHRTLENDLNRIATYFKAPKITLVIRNPNVNDGDIVLTNEDDLNTAILAIRKSLTHD